MKDGVCMDKILDDVRDSVNEETGLLREHLISRQDIRNIQTQFNVEGIFRHSQDAMSVDI